MKKGISATLAVTMIASNVSTVVYAQQQELNSENLNLISNEVAPQAKGQLELDLNFDLPIKYANVDTTNMTVKLKQGGEILGEEIALGSDNLSGQVTDEIGFELSAKDSTKANLSSEDNELSFYHLTLTNLPLGTYELEIVGAGYETAVIQNIDIQNTSKRVLVGTSDNTVTIGEEEETYPGLFLAGNVDQSDSVKIEDYNILKEGIKSKARDIKFDLNRDGKVDITDLTYVHQNLDAPKKDAIILDTDVIVDMNRSSVAVDESKFDVIGNVENIFEANSNTLTLQTKSVADGVDSEISESNPVSININLNNTLRSTTPMKKVVIKAPSENAPATGSIVIPGAGENGQDLEIDYSNENVVTKNGVDEIVIDLGKQVAVSQITINVTGGRGNKNLVEIAQVEFLNDVYKEIPEPDMNVPVITNFTSNTAVGKEDMTIGWEHEPNVTGYEIKVEQLASDGSVANTSMYKTNKNSLNIKEVEGYAIYRISIQSLSGSEWESGYKDEQEGYDKTVTGNTNLLNNSNDKDGIADNVDAQYTPQGWVSTGEGPLADNNPMYGQDSIVEMQVIPETRPEGPEGIKIEGLYKGLSVSWEDHKKAEDYDLYYREIGEGAWSKANDPNEPKYVDSNVDNDIPDGVAELSPEQKTDHDELVRGTSYDITGLEEGKTYEIKMTATNHHGTGGLSETYLGATTTLNAPKVPKYKMINTDSEVEGELANNIESITFDYTDDKYVGNPLTIMDGSYGTGWKITGWDGGGAYNSSRMPVVTFDEEYTFDTMRMAPLVDNPVNGYPYRARLRVYDDAGNVSQIIESDQIVLKNIKDENGVLYTEIVLDEPITAKKVELNLSVYGSYHVSVAELKFYEYDSLKTDVDNLFKDDLLLDLNENVTQEMIDELTQRARTIDPASMEYHPDQDVILTNLQRAQDILDDINLNDKIITLNPAINGNGVTIGQTNAWQSLGVAVKPGDKVNIYIGSDRANTTFNLAITQFNAESSTAVQTYSQQLRVGKNEIVIPDSAFDMNYEKGGNLYLNFAGNFNTTQNVNVRVSGGTEIPHLNVNNLIGDNTKEQEVKALINEYIEDLENYMEVLPNRYPSEASANDNANNRYTYDPETSILNATEIEGDRIMLSLPASEVLKGIQSGVSTREEQVDKLYKNLLAWEQIMQISHSHQGLIEEPIDFDGDGKITTTPLDVLGGISETQYFEENQVPQNRMNIKYQRMFTGAFMYAGSHHVGIGFDSSASMMNGIAFEYDENKNVTNLDEGNFFGWGISHEIGHVHDRPGLTYDEVTNNILALITQTYNDKSTSRVEEIMPEVYDRVTSQSVGTPQGFVGLTMFWQLHLAYDNENTYDMLELNSDSDLSNDTFYAKLYRTTREKGIAPNESGHDQTAQTYVMRASDAVQKDLRPFFESWGIVASPNTNAYLDEMNYPVETENIQYLSDEARRRRLAAIEANDMSMITMAEDTQVSASFGADGDYINNNIVPINISVNKDQNKILGYEIIRVEATSGADKEVPVGFISANQESNITTFNDEIDGNNKVFTYKVKAYDYDLNVSEEYEVGTVKVSHDGAIAKTNWKFDTNTHSHDDELNEESGHGHNEFGTINNIKDNDDSTVYNGSRGAHCDGEEEAGDLYVTIDMGTKNQIVGLRYTPPQTEAKKFSLRRLFGLEAKSEVYQPITDYEVLVSEDGEEWTKVHEGTFEANVENTIYFNEAGDNSNTQLWATNSQYVKVVSKGAETISIAEIDILGQPGDNIEIGTTYDKVETNGLGRLKSDYEYAPGKTIPQDSIIITGEYRGNPAFNVPLVLNENGENLALQAQTILLAELPQNAQLDEVAKGTWIYWITPEQQDLVVDGEANILGTQVKAELYRYNRLDENNAPLGQRLVSDTFLYNLPSDLNNLPVIDLTSNKSISTSNIVEIDNEAVNQIMENKEQ